MCPLTILTLELDLCAEDFLRYLRTTGQKALSEQAKLTWWWSAVKTRT